MNVRPIHGLVLDLFSLACVTVLALARVLDHADVTKILVPFFVALAIAKQRAAARASDHPPPGPGGVAGSSAPPPAAPGVRGTLLRLGQVSLILGVVVGALLAAFGAVTAIGALLHPPHSET